MQYTKVSKSTTLKFNELVLDVKMQGFAQDLVAQAENDGAMQEDLTTTGSQLLENDDFKCIQHQPKGSSQTLKLEDQSTSAILTITAKRVTAKDPLILFRQKSD